MAEPQTGTSLSNEADPSGDGESPMHPDRVTFILRQIDGLPTLPAVAARLLQLTSSDDSHAKQVTELIAADPSLTARLLGMCRKADKGVHSDVITVDKAVVLLGFNAVRNAVLSVKVFETFEADRSDQRFDRSGFWVHALAVAVAAEQIAQRLHLAEARPDEAFVCGLLHDLGKLALDRVLPRAFSRCLEMAETRQCDLATCEQTIIGLDHHTAGKRLAEQWKLPHRLADCIWLHGTPYAALPNLPHRTLIGIVQLADGLARQQHVGTSGSHGLGAANGIEPLAETLGLNAGQVRDIASELHERVEERGRILGLHEQPTREMFLDSIQHANASLGRLNETLEQRSRLAGAQKRVLDTLTTFNEARRPGQSVSDVVDDVLESARGIFGDGYFGVLVPDGRQDLNPQATEVWQLAEAASGSSEISNPTRRLVERPSYAPDLRILGLDHPGGLKFSSLMPQIADALSPSADHANVRALPMSCGWGNAGILLYDHPSGLPNSVIRPLLGAWGAAIAVAGKHLGAIRLGDDLAEANSELSGIQSHLLDQASMARLGEMAAGAAHEMNNPLTVIAGRSQVLAQALPHGSKEHTSALLIAREAHRLSNLITCLHLFADPPSPNRDAVDISLLIQQIIGKLNSDRLRRQESVQFSVSIRSDVPVISADPELLTQALTELIENAIQSSPKDAIQISVVTTNNPHTLEIRVIDDGDGMSPHTLSHALDPFFSVRPAGRRVGMGLPRARKLMEAHGGDLRLRSVSGRGTTASLVFPLDMAA